MTSPLVTVDFTIPEEELKISQRALGEGACSRVFQAKWNGAAVAIKHIQPDSLRRDRSSRTESEETRHLLEALRRELCVMCSLRHPNVVRLFGVCAAATHHVGLVMELMETSLQARTSAGPPLTTPCLIHVLHDLTSALVYLHSRKIVHRDISPRNILMSGDTAQRRLIAKLSDFATAKAVDTIDFDRYNSPSGLMNASAYLPCEVIDKDPETQTIVYSNAVDVYSLGAVGLFTVLKKDPGSTPKAKQSRLQNLGSDNALRGVLKKCLDEDPRLRPTSAEVQALLEELQGPDAACQERCCALSAPIATGLSSSDSSRKRMDHSNRTLSLPPPRPPRRSSSYPADSAATVTVLSAGDSPRPIPVARSRRKVTINLRPASVEQFLQGFNLAQYTSCLVEYGWDEVEFLNLLSGDDLRDCGVTNPNHHKMILDAIIQLKLPD